jgi:WASH complex subunit 7
LTALYISSFPFFFHVLPIIFAFPSSSFLFSLFLRSDASTSPSTPNTTEREKTRVVFLEAYRSCIIGVIKADIALPLSLEIETNLRINTHIKHLPHMTTADLRASHFGPLSNFLNFPAIIVLGVLFDIKKEVTRYLDRNFYNLVTVSIPDSLS